eukprot:1666245-Rhodomonas_salina.1
MSGTEPPRSDSSDAMCGTELAYDRRTCLGCWSFVTAGNDCPQTSRYHTSQAMSGTDLRYGTISRHSTDLVHAPVSPYALCSTDATPRYTLYQVSVVAWRSALRVSAAMQYRRELRAKHKLDGTGPYTLHPTP